MQPDDEICLCYHVSLRKLVNYAQRVRPRHASQMTRCLGAGTGCGWCIPILCRIAAQAGAGEAVEIADSPEEHAAARRRYHREAKLRRQFE
jgi:NAD(P)H-nitrite reductase large subunit